MLYVAYSMKHGLLAAATDMNSAVAAVDFSLIKEDGPVRLTVTVATDELAAIIERKNAELMASDPATRAPDAWDRTLAAIEIGELMSGLLGTPAEAKASIGDAGAFRGVYIGELDGLAGHSADVIVTVDGTEAKFTGTGTGYDNTWTEFPDSAFIPEDNGKTVPGASAAALFAQHGYTQE